ncbi:hypothetical protein [uncultured Nocardioides sp.]|uniref:hypothetical protein n=1 Tax=uncultured Nocardioides sp. TaxID=198441 RepID=UPI002638A7B3|nr:hypothetical protein [uncultured Nocardioides sp.]
MKLLHRIALVSAMLLTTALGVAVPASASAPDSKADDAPDLYCSIYLPTGDEACFLTFEESTSWAQDTAQASSALSAGTESSALSSFLLARLYEDKNKQGGIYSIFGDGPCDNTGGYEWELDTFSATYNNEISSFQGYSNCDVKLFENISFNASPGATYGPYASSNDVGAMNDKASSARFY